MNKYWKLKMIEDLIKLDVDLDAKITMENSSYLKKQKNLIEGSYKDGYKDGIESRGINKRDKGCLK